MFYLSSLYNRYGSRGGVTIVTIVGSASITAASDVEDLGSNNPFPVLRNALPGSGANAHGIRLLIAERYEPGKEHLTDFVAYRVARTEQYRSRLTPRRIAGRSVSETLRLLERHGVHRDHLPRSFGGNYDYSRFDEWIRIRLSREGGAAMTAALPRAHRIGVGGGHGGHTEEDIPDDDCIKDEEYSLGRPKVEELYDENAKEEEEDEDDDKEDRKPAATDVTRNTGSSLLPVFRSSTVYHPPFSFPRASSATDHPASSSSSSSTYASVSIPICATVPSDRSVDRGDAPDTDPVDIAVRSSTHGDDDRRDDGVARPSREKAADRSPMVADAFTASSPWKRPNNNNNNNGKRYERTYQRQNREIEVLAAERIGLESRNACLRRDNNRLEAALAQVRLLLAMMGNRHPPPPPPPPPQAT